MNSEKFFVVSRLDFLTIVLKKYVNIFWNDVFSKIYIRYRILFWGATLWFTVQLINGKGKFYIFERIDKWNSHIKYFNSQSSSSILSNLTSKSCNLFKMISLCLSNSLCLCKSLSKIRPSLSISMTTFSSSFSLLSFTWGGIFSDRGCLLIYIYTHCLIFTVEKYMFCTSLLKFIFFYF